MVIFTNPPEKILGWRSSNFKDQQHPIMTGMNGLQESAMDLTREQGCMETMGALQS
jgi:hypothetical protein